MKYIPFAACVFLSPVFCLAQDLPKKPAPIQPSFEMTILHPPKQVSTNGKSMLFYELKLTNFYHEPLSLRRLEIFDSKNSISALDEKDILSRLYKPGKRTKDEVPSAMINAGSTAIIYIELQTQPPLTLQHRITFQRAEQNSEPVFIDGANCDIDNTSSIVLGPPLSGGPWVAIYEPSWERGHRRVIYTIDGQARIPGRFAIDFIKVDDSGFIAKGDDADRNEIKNWYGYGANVLAVADGVVASTRDDFSESPTLSAHPAYSEQEATGNYVSIRIGENQFAFYEHLKPTSVRVKPGQKVKKGDVIASLGFTGQTTGPHLHFHVAEKDSPLGAEGIPFVIDNFTLLGSYPDLSVFDKERWQTVERGTNSKIKNELPGANTAITFD
ncbi:MAG: M23 family metallopeptidase [Bacteroidota bacterium]